MMEFQGRQFRFALGSDVQRDGMYYEAVEVLDGETRYTAELFYSDELHTMTFTAAAPNLPIELVEHMIEQGHKRLVPIDRAAEVD